MNPHDTRMPSTYDIVTALGATLAAAEEASRLQHGVTSRNKADGSPVTDGDLAADASIRAVINERSPEDAIFSEEFPDDPSRLHARRVWIIDPIDGTKEYLAGKAEWAVQVALTIDGELILGVLAMPGLGVTILGIPGLGAWNIIDHQRHPLTCAAGNDHVLVSSSSRRNQAGLERVLAALPEFSVSYIFSIGVKSWSIISGATALFVHPKPLAEWDVAAPAAVLLGAGGRATDLSGAALRFNSASGYCPSLVMSRRKDHDSIISRLSAGDVHLAS